MSRLGFRGSNPKRDANEPAIVAGLERCGWKVTRISIKDWPDLHIGKGYKNFWIEVKMPGEKCSEGQLTQHERMRLWGMEVLVANDLDILLRWLGDIH